MTVSEHDVKRFYAGYHDRITDKRLNSPHWPRRHAHRAIYARIVRRVFAGEIVLDAGCGEGGLSLALAEKGARVIGADLSIANVRAAGEAARDRGLTARFVVADLERLPFRDDSFDRVVCSHVVEHLPDPHAGLVELRRTTRTVAVIAMPTCLNPGAWALLGGDGFWQLSKRSPFAVPLGLLRTIVALVAGREGPQQGYAGKNELPHVWRFPWAMLRLVRDAGFVVEDVEAGPLVVPYAGMRSPRVRRMLERLDELSRRPVVRYLGYGTHVIGRK